MPKRAKVQPHDTKEDPVPEPAPPVQKAKAAPVGNSVEAARELKEYYRKLDKLYSKGRAQAPKGDLEDLMAGDPFWESSERTLADKEVADGPDTDT